VFVIGSIPLALYAVAQSQGWDFLPYSRTVTESGMEEIGTKQRVSSLFGHPNHLASYLAPLMYWGLYFAFARFPRMMRVTGAVAALAILGAMVVGGTRGAWVAVAGAAVPYYLLLTFFPGLRRQLLFSGGVGLLLALLILFVPNPLVHVQFNVSERLFGSKEISARFYYWMMALEMLKESPVLGAGYNHFNVLFWDAVDVFQRAPESDFMRFILTDSIRGVLPGYVHNDFLQTAAETGISGLAVWLGVWSVLLSQMWETGRRLVRTPRHLLMAATFLASFSVFGLDGMFNFPLQLPVSGFLFWTMVGAWVLFRTEIRRGPVQREDRSRSKAAAISPEIPRVSFPRQGHRRRQ
jgi:O-antigen ligase